MRLGALLFALIPMLPGCSAAPPVDSLAVDPTHTPSPRPTPTPARTVSPDARPFGEATVEPAFELEGPGSDIDSIAFWEAPDVAGTLMFVTAKDNDLVEVWRHPFVEDEPESLIHPSFGTESQVNGVVVDQLTDRLYVAVSEPASTVVVFSLPGLEPVAEFLAGDRPLGSEPNLGLLRTEDETRLYVSTGDEIIVLDAADGERLGAFEPPGGVETVAGDDHHGMLYVPDEGGGTGVSVHGPDGEPVTNNGLDRIGPDAFDADAEGVLVYACAGEDGTDDGRGLIVVADQRLDQTEFEVFERGSWAHLGIVRIAGVANTDGIGSIQADLPGHPLGLFAAVDDDATTVGLGWDVILEATGLGC
jgi:hypothetical protein